MATIYNTTVVIAKNNSTFTITEDIPATSKIQADLIMLQRFSNKKVLFIHSK